MTRIKLIISIVVAIALSVTLLGEAKPKKTFLYRIEAKHGSCYLLGSVHLLRKEIYPLPAIIEKSFDECDALVVEADLTGEKLMKSSMLLLKKAVYPKGETLQDNVSKETYRKIEEKLKGMGIKLEKFNKFKPWMVAMTVVHREMIRMGLDPNFGIDLYFLRKARGKKEILELEGVEFQINLFENFTKKESELFLLKSILEADQIANEVDDTVDAWLKGDEEKLAKLLTDNVVKNPELKNVYNKIAVDRNPGMLKKIVSFIKKGKKCFVVVGAAHVVGKDGLVQLLRDSGYNVTQL